jgi:DNA invertase Pin-like site-specific DNA recombinase
MTRSKTPTESVKAVGYIRVSTEKQADHGISLDAQQAKLTAYAQLYDIELVEVIVDAGVSAKTLKRPGLQTALTMLRKGQANALLVTKLDRLTRKVKDLATLIEDYFASDKITLLSVGDTIDTRTAAGRLVLNVLISVAQWEREVIGERTEDAWTFKRSKGERTAGYLPYGYELGPDGKKLVANENEQELLTAIRNWRSQGLSQRAIVADLGRHGFTTRRGTALTLLQVQRIMHHAQIA